MQDSEKSRNQLVAEIFELKRIENFLRAEVSELWDYVNKLEVLPFFRFWVKIATKLNYKNRYQIGKYQENFPTNKVTSIRQEVLNCDFLFVFSSDLHEIGGLKTASKLARDLSKLKNSSTNGLALSHNPTIANEDGFFVYDVLPQSRIKNVVACGSDTIDTAIKMTKDFDAKLILLMMGLDQIFAPSWYESKNYVKAMQLADLVICLSPHLANQAKLYGSKNIAVATLGFDQRDFYYEGLEKNKKILIPCRTSPEKGLKVILPAIKLIRDRGWEVVGFGDLNDLASAEVFDRFIGRVSPSDLKKEFQDTRFLIDPSWVEGLGLVALEAAACGVMPIITARADYAELFKESSKPFFEVANFINPENLLAILEDPDKWIQPEQLCSRVSALAWENGLDQTYLALKDFI